MLMDVKSINSIFLDLTKNCLKLIVPPDIINKCIGIEFVLYEVFLVAIETDNQTVKS